MILFFLDQSFKNSVWIEIIFQFYTFFKFSHFFITFQPFSLCDKATKKVFKYYVEL